MTLKLAPHTEDILALYDSGISMTEISRRYGTYLQPVSNLVKKHRTVPSVSGTINSRYFSEIDSHIKAYFVGFIAGDGAIVKSSRCNSTTLTITLNKRDACVLEKLRDELGMSRKLWYFVSQGRFDHVRLITSDKQIISDLMALGIEPRKSLTMPDILKNLPNEYKNSFILGLFDADGSCCVRVAPWTKRSTGKTYSYVKQAASLRATLPMCHAIVKQLGLSTFHINTSDSIPNLVVGSKTQFIKFFNLIYADCEFYLKRKYEKFLPIVYQDQTISSPVTNTAN